ncbi:MAG: extracellular solute-binding protein [Anaerolineales bacterium]|nr:extracellular solute-binding protein [Anaerolineales bacterium]
MLLQVAGMLFLIGLLTACGGDAEDGDTASDKLKGSILIWHDWVGQEKTTLEELLAKFEELNPGVDVISLGMETETLVQQLAERSQGALGPDMLVVDADALQQLVEADLVQNLNGRSHVDERRFTPAALETTRNQDGLWGLPFTLHTQLLFYNKSMVDKPPRDLDELVEQVNAGKNIALATGFNDAFWGLGAFDGQAFDDQGRLSLGRGGFTNWLDFLQRAQSIPGFMLDEDRERLRQAFMSGEVALYAADSVELPMLRSALGDNLGVSALPAGPGQSAATPVLETEAIAFTNVASKGETDLAMALADYLTSSQPQLRIATDNIGQAPTNARVRLGKNIPPGTAALVRQQRSARPVGLRFRGIWNLLSRPDSTFSEGYRKALAGVISPNEFVRRTVSALADRYGVSLAPATPATRCPDSPAIISVWHALRQDEAAALERIATSFALECTGAEVSFEYVDYNEISDTFAEAVKSGQGPDVFFESSRWLPPLVDQKVLRDVSGRVNADVLQQFIPGAVESMRQDGRLYGIPESVTTLALFYNRGLTKKLPIDLDDLLQSVGPNHHLALPATFFYGYWGMVPFGGFEIDPESGKVTDSTALEPWLEWLKMAQQLPGVDIYDSITRAEDQFAAGKATYLVSGPWSLARLRKELGTGAFGVVALPAGPFGPGSPMLQVQGLMISAAADEAAVDTAIAFAEYLNAPESQMVLSQTGSHISASVGLDLTGYSQINGFREQAKSAVYVIENARFINLERLGNEMYRQVLEQDVSPADAVNEFLKAADAAANQSETAPQE